MNGTKRAAAAVGKVILVLVGGMLFPVLIWVALGVALNQKLRAGRAQGPTAPTIGEILGTARWTGGREVAK